MAYTFRIHCRASDDYSLAIVDGDVILTKADPNDDRQARLRSIFSFRFLFASPCFQRSLVFNAALAQGREVR
jgi:hypothetical protein